DRMNEILAGKLSTLPEHPGSYQMRDATGAIIYVGKAKNLKNRVKTYFIGSHDLKTTKLVSLIDDLTYIVTKTELEAFLLELSLIKEHRPKYNIMLMDDKTYPYIEITKERHPRVVITRKIDKKRKNIFGPYPDSGSARETLFLIHRIFPLRKCDVLPKKVCLYYHMGQCLGPCVHPVSVESNEAIISDIVKFLNGNDQDLLKDLRQKMADHAEKMEYEKAKEYKDLIAAVVKTTERQQVMFSDLLDRDAVAFAADDAHLAVTIIFMRKGRIVMSDSEIIDYLETPEDAFLDFVARFYAKHPAPAEVLLPKGTDLAFLKPALGDAAKIPVRGNKLKFAQMAAENATIHLANSLDQHLKKYAKTVGAATALGDLLGIAAPKRIECFDNSHTMGTNPVSAMVVFTDGNPDKKAYRKYQIKTAAKGDDPGAMKEIVYRRYQKMLMTGAADRPDLVIMDGGITQVRACKETLAALYLDLPVIGLKKDSFHKTDAIIGLDEAEIPLDRHAPLYVLLNKIQEEAHRFAITYHHEKQSKQIYASILDAIPKIGKASKTKLLEKFKTIENIKKASDEDLKAIGLTKDAIANLRIALSAT
ncbi:MAG: excinuclease ABC subunit UvrC, partial [Bacillota bacterium]|nr:excinuclease ABC subunit UvrC [Bacillota bacterium]